MAWTELWRVVLMLAFIVVLIFSLSAMLKRFGGVRAGGPAPMRVLATLPLGNRDRIFLVQVGEEQLLVGSSAAGLRTLHTLQTNLVFENKTQADAAAPKFAELLRMVGKSWNP